MRASTEKWPNSIGTVRTLEHAVRSVRGADGLAQLYAANGISNDNERDFSLKTILAKIAVLDRELGRIEVERVTSNQAAGILAGMGLRLDSQKQGTADSSESNPPAAKSDADTYAEFMNIPTGTKRAAFFKANEAALNRHMATGAHIIGGRKSKLS